MTPTVNDGSLHRVHYDAKKEVQDAMNRLSLTTLLYPVNHIVQQAKSLISMTAVIHITAYDESNHAGNGHHSTLLHQQLLINLLPSDSADELLIYSCSE